MGLVQLEGAFDVNPAKVTHTETVSRDSYAPNNTAPVSMVRGVRVYLEGDASFFIPSPEGEHPERTRERIRRRINAEILR